MCVGTQKGCAGHLFKQAEMFALKNTPKANVVEPLSLIVKSQRGLTEPKNRVFLKCDLSTLAPLCPF